MNVKKTYSITQLPFHRRLTTKLIFIFISLVSITILVLGVILITTTRDSIERSISERNQIVAKRSANEIRLYLEKAFDLLRTISWMPEISQMGAFAQTFIINKLKDQNPIFRRIFILDVNKKKITSTAFSEIQTPHWKDTYFNAALKGKTFFSSVFIAENQLPAMFVVEPIKKFGDVVGVLVAEVDLKNIWDLVDSITIGKKGNAFVVSGNGKLIAYKEKKRVYEQEVLSHLDVVTRVINGEEGTAIFHTISNEEVIGAFTPIQPLGWGIVIQQPTKEAFALATRQIILVTIGMFISILIALLIGIFMTRRIVEPIEDLVDGSHRVSEGDLEHRLQIHTQDEFGMLAEEFNRMAGKLGEQQVQLRRAERLATLSKFASIISHEIRNPLNAMSINMQMLKREILKNKPNIDKQTKYFDIVASEINRVDELINNFLTLARPQKLSLKPERLQTILDDVIISQQAKALNQGIRVERKFVEDKILVNVDIDQIKQVFLNIIINALEAMPGGGKLKITAQTDFYSENAYPKMEKSENNSTVYISFQDSGVGIPSKKIKDVFEFYFTTKMTGTGLGLSIARQIVESHNGGIYIQSGFAGPSSQNCGTRITISLPKLEK